MALFLTNRFRINIKKTVKVKPKKGDTIKDKPVFMASSQFTAAPEVLSGNKEKATPTPKIEPIKVCELEEGNP